MLVAQYVHSEDMMHEISHVVVILILTKTVILVQPTVFCMYLPRYCYQKSIVI